MFQSARFKLTAWYLLLIILISTLFSIVIYFGINSELRRLERFQQRRLERDYGNSPAPLFQHRPILDHELIEETDYRLKLVLLLVNLGIFVLSGGAAYFLSGRTLKPIKNMVDEQNRFITDSSHELRTPLTSLRSELEVNLRSKNISPNETKKILRSNLEEVMNLQKLTDNLMELAQYQKRNGDLSMSEISLLDVINKVCRKFTPVAFKNKIRIINKVQDCNIVGDKPALSELFTILLDNALKYSDKNTKINLSSIKEKNVVSISVADEGMGIEKKDLPYIFDRFYRAEKSRSKEKVTGYGLGLSIAKKIVELHKGTIKAESVPLKGSKFTVVLPLS